MRTSQSFGVHFTVKKDKVKDGIACVYAVITINKDITFKSNLNGCQSPQFLSNGLRRTPVGVLIINKVHWRL